MMISELPNELQNKIFYYLQHPVAEVFNTFVCHDCKRIKRNYHRCVCCDMLMCVRCEDYDKICYSSNDKDDELVCVKCLELDMFDYCHELFYQCKASFQRGVFERILFSA